MFLRNILPPSSGPCCAYHLLHAAFLFGLMFDSENGDMLPENWLTFNGVTPFKKEHFITTAVRTGNPTAIYAFPSASH
jgi:hypothetical protein